MVRVDVVVVVLLSLFNTFVNSVGVPNLSGCVLVLNNMCFTYNHTRVRYEEADRNCREEGGIIVPPKSASLLRLLASKAPEGQDGRDPWIGLRKDTDDSDWLLSDGSKLNFNPWEMGEPLFPFVHCAYLDVRFQPHLLAGTWCTVERPYFCQHECTLVVDNLCFTYNRTRVNYDEAERNCKASGGLLAPPKSVALLRELAASAPVSDAPDPWIGLRKDSDNGEWMQSDGSKLYFSPWEVGEPLFDFHHCANLDVRFKPNLLSGTWCSVTRPYFCQYELKRTATTSSRRHRGASEANSSGTAFSVTVVVAAVMVLLIASR